MFQLCRRWVACAVALCLASTVFAVAADEPDLTEEQIREFLLNAEVVGYKRTSKGKTGAMRLTLSDGTLRHDAAFQSIDESKDVIRFRDRTELNFRDSYRFNIAAYELAKLLGLGDMIPVTVDYKWKGKNGSLSWWIPAKWDEQTRREENVRPADRIAWSQQVNRMRVFGQLVYDTDRNLTNMLITEDWKLVMIDFSRAFRRQHELEDPTRLAQCCRKLLEKLRQLDEAQVREATKPHLRNVQVQAIMARRDRIVAHFEQLIAQHGEDQVLY
jgi:hypothetical protein